MCPEGYTPPPETHQETGGSASVSDQDKASQCVICRGDLPVGAIYCTKCQRYQDWRRYFGLSGVLLTLLVALISVLNTAVPVIVKSLTPDSSDVQFSVVDWKPSAVLVAVSNGGARPAVVRNLELADRSDSPTTGKTPLTLWPANQDKLLEPGAFRLLTFAWIQNGTQIPVPESPDTKASQLLLFIFPFRSESNRILCGNWGAAR